AFSRQRALLNDTAVVFNRCCTGDAPECVIASSRIGDEIPKHDVVGPRARRRKRNASSVIIRERSNWPRSHLCSVMRDRRARALRRAGYEKGQTEQALHRPNENKRSESLRRPKPKS